MMTTGSDPNGRSGSEVLGLATDRVHVTVHPADGGRIGQITVDGVDMLRGPDVGAADGWGWWGCYPLLPWSNRIPGGRIRCEDRELRVPVNWTDGTALHGLTAWIPWTVVEASDREATVTVEVRGGDYHVRGDQSVRLTETHLDLDLAVTNLSKQRLPVGLGIHPWFRAGPVLVPADLTWPGEPLPTGAPRPVTRDEDLRTRRAAPPMDRCFTGLTSARVEVPGLTLSWRGPVTQVVVYSEAPGWVCVEPVTMANDGFRMHDEGRTDTGVLILDPGEEATVSYRFTW